MSVLAQSNKLGVAVTLGEEAFGQKIEFTGALARCFRFGALDIGKVPFELGSILMQFVVHETLDEQRASWPQQLNGDGEREPVKRGRACYVRIANAAELGRHVGD